MPLSTYPLRLQRQRHAATLAMTLALAFAALVPRTGLAQTKDHAAAKALPAPPSVVELETDGVDGMSGQMADELARLYDDGTTRRALTIIGKTAGQNLRDLQSLRGIDMAILPMDLILQTQAGKSPHDSAGGFTYAAPLWTEELHVLARSDVQTITDLANKQIDVGPPDSASSVTAERLFGLLNLPYKPVQDRAELAVEKLQHNEVDAVVIVAAKPSELLQTLLVPQGWHLLSIPPEKAVTDAYAMTAVDAADYPGLVPKNEPVQTISVQTVLAVANLLPTSERYRSTCAFVTAVLDGTHSLQDQGHAPKWKAVDVTAGVPGLTRFPIAQAWVDRSKAASPLASQDARSLFSRYIDSRQQVLGGPPLSDQAKQALFEQFQRWQATESRPAQ